MGARGFILVLLLFAVIGAGAGYGAAQLVPMEEEEQAPETADLVAPGAGGADAAAGAGAGTGRARQTGGQPSVDDFIAALPEEQRRELESNPEAAAMARAQIQMAIDSGMIPAEALQGLAGGGAAGDAPDAAGAEGVRNAEPLAGTVVSFERRYAAAGDAGRRGCDRCGGRRAGEPDEDRGRLVGLPRRRSGGVGGRPPGRVGRTDGCRSHRRSRGTGRRRRAWLRWSRGCSHGDGCVVRGWRAHVGDCGRSGGVHRSRMIRRCASPRRLPRRLPS